MNEIRRVLKAAAWRLLILDVFRTLAVTLSAAVGALILLLLVQRIFGLEIDFQRDWTRLFAAAAGGAVVAAMAWSLILVGAALRIARYLDNRSLWLDEVFLTNNLLHRSFAGLLKRGSRQLRTLLQDRE